MSTPTLGRLERVDLRQAWTSESGDFTPWLATEENLKLLGDTIGLDLELEATERFVGPFRADIVCRDIASENSWILIENQLERTNHTHLGQLITYAAGLSAVTIVWIAERFTEEHRAALDWLNSVTNEGINIFGLEVELWRIGNSPPAPKFNIISKPNNWTESVKAAARSGEISSTKQQYLEYWTEFVALLDQEPRRVRKRTPRPQQWMDFSIGRSGFTLRAMISATNQALTVQFVMESADAKYHFEQLEREQSAIDQEAGASLAWRERGGKQASIIQISRPNSDPLDREEWPEQHRWLIRQLETFHRIFAPRVRSLVGNDTFADSAEPDTNELAL